jgi:hypothetical protein
MRLPVVRGTIDRRILANFRFDPEVMRKFLPAPFRPKLASGYAIGGICLIRLSAIRPKVVPLRFGIRSENAAHRIAVEWDGQDGLQEGVYIPRRDTSAWTNVLAGGTVFPGEHHHASFTVEESGDAFAVSVSSDDGTVEVRVAGSLGQALPESSIFRSVDEASQFFERGALGYSRTGDPGRFDGLELRCKEWRVEPLQVDLIESSFFEDATRFPASSVEFDCGLLMRGIDHEWHSQADLCCRLAAEI